MLEISIYIVIVITCLPMQEHKPSLIVVDNKQSKNKKLGKAVCLLKSKTDDDKKIVRRCDFTPDPKVCESFEEIDGTGHYSFHHIYNDKAKRDTLYVCGPNQAGKSTYVAEYLRNFHKAHKDMPILLFSKLEEDSVLDDIDAVERVVCEELPEEFNIEEYADTMCVFDDIDQFSKDISNTLIGMINEILCNGAHHGISIVITNHLLSDYKKTRTILNEVSCITVFPHSGCSYQLKDVLKRYVGMEKKQIEKVANTPSRWVTIFKDYPLVVLHQKGCYIV